ncbi:hypothetical protein COLO4_21324 [Corchorus olitorius]|uniref:Uncharacterized protein n=1 Tax=Corchorus olitorius TaxID=93759 RepID=A0A1R3IU05_9ROSI|nr:hypothetical protein COLO4_21324 [Corchorus olitorius]
MLSAIVGSHSPSATYEVWIGLSSVKANQARQSGMGHEQDQFNKAGY